MNLQLDGKVALVTAASRGLGFAVADCLAQEGALVIMSSRTDDVHKAAARITGRDVHTPLAFKADLTSAKDIEFMVSQAMEHAGRIDILFINAGGPAPGRFMDLEESQWLEAVTLTIMSAVRLCRAVAPVMISQGEGSIVASQSISVKQPVDNLMLSNALRPAVVGMTKSLADELGPRGIRVNSIHPGWTKTARVEQLLESRVQANGTSFQTELERVAGAIPLGRMGTPEEFARAAVWLASPAASFVHGQALVVDGGQSRFPL